MDEHDEPGWSRSEWARWWLDHSEPDEAARALEAGDEVKVAGADALDLAAALKRRGLGSAYEDGVLFISQLDERAVDRTRRPPLRATGPMTAPAATKKTA